MTDARAPRLVRIDLEPIAAIELGGRAGGKQPFRWGVMLVWFMRVVAILWVLHSLLNWSIILGVGGLGGSAVALLGTRGFAATIFFAVVNPIAAVGLWLATPWGGVTWLLAVAAQIFAVALLPGLFESGPLMIVTNAALVACYFILTFAASRERDTD